MASLWAPPLSNCRGLSASSHAVVVKEIPGDAAPKKPDVAGRLCRFCLNPPGVLYHLLRLLVRAHVNTRKTEGCGLRELARLHADAVAKRKRPDRIRLHNSLESQLLHEGQLVKIAFNGPDLVTLNDDEIHSRTRDRTVSSRISPERPGIGAAHQPPCDDPLGAGSGGADYLKREVWKSRKQTAHMLGEVRSREPVRHQRVAVSPAPMKMSAITPASRRFHASK